MFVADAVAVRDGKLAALSRLECQSRGLFRTEYEGATLRENLGLKRPPSRYAVS